MVGPVEGPDGSDGKIKAGIDVSGEMSREGKRFCMVNGLFGLSEVDGPMSVVRMSVCMSEVASKVLA
jgi:hypothetical protein